MCRMEPPLGGESVNADSYADHVTMNVMRPSHSALMARARPDLRFAA